MLAFITTIGNKEHDQNGDSIFLHGDSMIKVYKKSCYPTYDDDDGDDNLR